IDGRAQTGRLEHEPGAARQVFERGRAPERSELLPGDAIAELGLVTEREKRLAAPCRRPGTREVGHLFLAHVRPFTAARRARKRAVAADIAAELRQRDEDLRRGRDEPAVAGVAKTRGL